MSDERLLVAARVCDGDVSEVATERHESQRWLLPVVFVE